MSSCFVVLEEVETDIAPVITISPKPIIPMSDTLVRSVKGDMIAFLPKGWFFVDVEDKISSDVFAVAVNPDYTLSAVFSCIKSDESVNELVAKEGLIGLARSALTKKQIKSGDAIKLTGKYAMINMGTLSFCKYSYSTTGGALSALSVVFISSLNQYYEFAIVPMNIKNKFIPPQKEIEDIFTSIVTTIQY
jgi:hypothetical protein